MLWIVCVTVCSSGRVYQGDMHNSLLAAKPPFTLTVFLLSLKVCNSYPDMAPRKSDVVVLTNIALATEVKFPHMEWLTEEISWKFQFLTRFPWCGSN